MFKAAAFEMEYAGIIGKGASATNERLLTMAPLGSRQQRQESARHIERTKEIDS